MEGPEKKAVDLARFKLDKTKEISQPKHTDWKGAAAFFKTEFAQPEVRALYPELNATMLEIRMNDCLIALQEDGATPSPVTVLDVMAKTEAEISKKISETPVTERTADELLTYIFAVYVGLGGDFGNIK